MLPPCRPSYIAPQPMDEWFQGLQCILTPCRELNSCLRRRVVGAQILATCTPTFIAFPRIYEECIRQYWDVMCATSRAAVFPYIAWTMMHITIAHANMLSGAVVNPYAL